jgi:hypothetical protein
LRGTFSGSTARKAPPRLVKSSHDREKFPHFRRRQMISGAHVILYSKNAEADRVFFRDILGFKSIDAGLVSK